MRQTLLFFAVSALLILLFACGNTSSEEADAANQSEQAVEAADQEGPEYTSAYVCPMHCKGSGSDQPGQCPVCGMDYVAQADLPQKELHKHEGHDHDHDHDHDH